MDGSGVVTCVIPMDTSSKSANTLRRRLTASKVTMIKSLPDLASCRRHNETTTVRDAAVCWAFAQCPVEVTEFRASPYYDSVRVEVKNKSDKVIATFDVSVKFIGEWSSQEKALVN